MTPDPTKFCGPYYPSKTSQHIKIYLENSSSYYKTKKGIDKLNHDTIGMIIIDKNKDISVGTSSNGAINKIPG